MKRVYLIILLQTLITSACAQLKNDTVMVEKFNYRVIDGLSYPRVLLQEGDWMIDIFYARDTETGFQKEYAPARDFYVIQKEYHSNGMISSYTKLLGNVPFEYREYFDEKGQLVNSINEDAKFGKIKPRDFVAILGKIGWINRETGENIVTKEPLKTDGNFTMKLQRAIEIYFFPAEYGKDGKEIKPPIWRACYTSEYLHDNIKYYCYVDGNTGEYKLDQHEYYVIP